MSEVFTNCAGKERDLDYSETKYLGTYTRYLGTYTRYLEPTRR